MIPMLPQGIRIMNLMALGNIVENTEDGLKWASQLSVR